MTLFFKYKIIKRPDGTEVKGPSIPVVLNGKEKNRNNGHFRLWQVV